MKKVDYRHIICIIITLGIISLGLFRFFDSIGRIIEACRDFGFSVAYYFCELFLIPHAITPTVNNYAEIPFFDTPFASFAPSAFLSQSWEGFVADWERYWEVFTSEYNFNAYMAWLGEVSYYVCLVILICLPLVVVLSVVARMFLKRQNNNWGVDSRPLKVFKAVAKYSYRPAKKWIVSLIAFIRDNRAYWIIWACLFGLYFNAATIVIEFFAFYFYFVVSFDFVSIYRQVYKLICDLWAPFTFLPWWVWAIAALWLINDWRRKIGFARLRHNEMKNRGFINARPIVSMTCGTMGKKKTTMISDMALSQQVMFKDKAFEKLLEEDLKFPYFPWINLEKAI